MNERVLQSPKLVTKGSVVPTDEVRDHDRPSRESEKSACSSSLVPTIFHEDWWLEIASGGGFAVAEVKDAGRTIGRLPYHVTSRFGMKMIRMPALTYFLGPAVDEGVGSTNTRFLKRLDVTKELLQQLPRASWQYVKCQGGTTDMIAFQELGFRTYVQFTYEIAPDLEDVLWSQLRHKTRNNVRRAQDELRVTEWNDPSGFLYLLQRNLESKGIRNGLDQTLCKKLLTATLERKRGRIIAASDKQDNIVAANFCVWDETASYYLQSTRCDHSGNTAISLLLWEAIKESARRGLIFDFAGLGGKGSVSLYSGFGATTSPRYVAVRAAPLARLMNEVKFIFAPENPFY
jgi:hypothetical protein